jgi:hypothetical protein
MKRLAALKRLKNGDVAGAFSLCDEILSKDNDALLHLRTKSDLYIAQASYQKAILALEEVDLRFEMTPGDSFKICHCMLVLGAYMNSMAHANIALKKLKEGSAFRDSFLFIIAYSAAKLHLPTETRIALEDLDGNYSDYVYGVGVVTKYNIKEILGSSFKIDESVKKP